MAWPDAVRDKPDQADPGAEFRRSEGQRGLEASAAARGGILSGGALKAIARFNSDMASQEYGAAYSRFNNDTTTRYNRLAGLAGIGQQANSEGMNAGTNLTGQLQAGVNNITGNINAAGNARASQYANTGNVIAGLANNIGQSFGRRQPNSMASLVPDVNYHFPLSGGFLMPELDPRIITSIGENYARLPSINEGIAQRQGIQMRDMAIGQQQQAQALAE